MVKKAYVAISVLCLLFAISILLFYATWSSAALQSRPIEKEDSEVRAFTSNEQLYSYTQSQPYSNKWSRVESLEAPDPLSSPIIGIIPMSDIKEVFWLREAGCMVFKLQSGLNVSANPSKRTIIIEKGNVVIK